MPNVVVPIFSTVMHNVLDSIYTKLYMCNVESLFIMGNVPAYSFAHLECIVVSCDTHWGASNHYNLDAPLKL